MMQSGVLPDLSALFFAVILQNVCSPQGDAILAIQ